MSQNLVRQGPDNALVQRIEELERTVSQLKAAQAVSASNVTSGTITGSTVQTAATGQRVVLNGAADSIDIYTPTALAGNISGFDAGPAHGIEIGNAATTSFVQLTGGGNFLTLDNGSFHVFANQGITGNLAVSGNFSASGTKAFDIPYPGGGPGERLRYVAVEAPEVLVIARGTGETPDPPRHFADVTEPGSVRYVVGDDGQGGKNWIATGVRKGYAGYEPAYTEAT